MCASEQACLCLTACANVHLCACVFAMQPTVATAHGMATSYTVTQTDLTSLVATASTITTTTTTGAITRTAVRPVAATVTSTTPVDVAMALNHVGVPFRVYACALLGGTPPKARAMLFERGIAT